MFMPSNRLCSNYVDTQHEHSCQLLLCPCPGTDYVQTMLMPGMNTVATVSILGCLSHVFTSKNYLSLLFYLEIINFMKNVESGVRFEANLASGVRTIGVRRTF